MIFPWCSLKKNDVIYYKQSFFGKGFFLKINPILYLYRKNINYYLLDKCYCSSMSKSNIELSFLEKKRIILSYHNNRFFIIRWLSTGCFTGRYYVNENTIIDFDVDSNHSPLISVKCPYDNIGLFTLDPQQEVGENYVIKSERYGELAIIFGMFNIIRKNGLLNFGQWLIDENKDYGNDFYLEEIVFVIFYVYYFAFKNIEQAGSWCWN